MRTNVLILQLQLGLASTRERAAAGDEQFLGLAVAARAGGRVGGLDGLDGEVPECSAHLGAVV